MSTMGMSDENLDPQTEGEGKESRFNSLFDEGPSTREKAVKFISKILKNPRVWYVAGVIDTLLVIWAYNHFVK